MIWKHTSLHPSPNCTWHPLPDKLVLFICVSKSVFNGHLMFDFNFPTPLKCFRCLYFLLMMKFPLLHLFFLTAFQGFIASFLYFPCFTYFFVVERERREPLFGSCRWSWNYFQFIFFLLVAIWYHFVLFFFSVKCFEFSFDC